MGKNQAYKAMQRSRVGSTSAGPDEVEDGMKRNDYKFEASPPMVNKPSSRRAEVTLKARKPKKKDGSKDMQTDPFQYVTTSRDLMDGSFHSPEWHAARLASLNTSHTVTWEEFKKKQKEDELKKGELEADKDRMMREYRAQLDAERARKLSLGRNHSSSKSHNKKERKDKDARKQSGKKRKHRRKSKSESSSSSSSESTSSDDEERESRRSRSKLRSKRTKGKKHRSRTKQLSDNDSDNDGPVPLSRFFGSVKS